MSALVGEGIDTNDGVLARTGKVSVSVGEGNVRETTGVANLNSVILHFNTSLIEVGQSLEEHIVVLIHIAAFHAGNAGSGSHDRSERVVNDIDEVHGL